jgi:hypothetical protein
MGGDMLFDCDLRAAEGEAPSSNVSGPPIARVI